MMAFESHPTLEQLGDLLDGRLSPSERQPLEEHLLLCAQCADRWSRLDTLVANARALPEAIDPPADLWHGVDARIQPRSAKRARFTRRFWQLAAAATILVALSSGLTWLLAPRQTIVVVRPETTPVTPVAVVLPAPARSIDADYGVTIRELNDALIQHRSQLDPATVAKVEASLRVIDTAIAEARHAIAADPANLILLDILAANYERKLEVLRRANELLPST